MPHGSTRLSIAGASTRIKTAARGCADANQALTGLPGTIDSVGSWVAAQVILLTGQTDASENGLWRVRSGAWGRTSDLSDGKDAAGVSTFVSEGTSHGNKRWQCTNDTGTDVVGTDDLVWVAGATAYTHPTTAGNKHVPAAGASGEVLKYDSAGTAVWASSLPTYTEAGRKLASLKDLRMAWFPNGLGSQVGGIGGIPSTIFEQFEAARLDSDTGGHYLEIDSDNETGQMKSDVYVASTSYFYGARPLSNCYFSMRFSLPTLTNVRLFAGLCQYTDRDYITTADNPGRIYAGYQFSTGRPDTNFQFVHDTSASQELVDTGLAPATDVVYNIELEYTSDGTVLRGRISNAVTGAILMADTTHTGSNIATNKLIDYAPYLGVVTLAEEMKQFRFYRAEIWA